MSVNFVMTIPGPSEVTFDPDAQEWTASRDELRVAAVGRTRDEAIQNFHAAMWEAMQAEMQASWKRVPPGAS